MPSTRRPILVTGPHRSGTTWTGRLLASCRGVRYVHEPFALGRRACPCGFEPHVWFETVTDLNRDAVRRHFSHFIETPVHAYNVVSYWRDSGRGHGMKRYSRAAVRSLRGMRPFARILFKDPIALFAAEWLAREFSMQVVITTREPLGFAGSVRRLGWRHPFKHFVAQRSLMEGELAPFAERIRRAARDEPSFEEGVSLLWSALTHHALQLHSALPGSSLLSLDEIASDPSEAMGPVIDRLELAPRAATLRLLSAKRRDPRRAWQHLDERETRYIRSATEEVMAELRRARGEVERPHELHPVG